MKIEMIEKIREKIVLTDNNNWVVNDDYIGKYYHHNNSYRILGLPLTLERVFVALAKDFKQEFAMCGDFKCRVFWQDNVQEIFHWQPNTTLENQSDETIKAIYNILCV